MFDSVHMTKQGWNEEETAMQAWEAALHTFLADWREREEIVGILLCGSYVTGNPSQRSDLDVHLVLREEEDWRERGNRYVDGFLIEYFINPVRQIRQYFEEDYNDRSTMSMVQFITGKVLLDRTGAMEQLKQEALQWKEKHYAAVEASMVEVKKYSLWDAYDNLMDCMEQERADSELVYYQSLLHLFNEYCAILAIEQIPYYQITRYLTEPAYLEKYLKAPFPDCEFAEMFLAALAEGQTVERLNGYERLLHHVYDRAGGFHIDGWRLRTPVQA